MNFLHRMLLILSFSYFGLFQIAQADEPVTALSEDVRVTPMMPTVWRHITDEIMDGERIPANGLIVQTGKGVVLVDTGWNNDQTVLLLNWIKQTLKQPVIAAVVSHSHNDRMGGIDTLLQQNIPVYAHAKTADIARTKGLSIPTRVFQDTVDVTPDIQLFYPGAGHAPDNIVVWLPKQGLLFGGCLIKAGNATTYNPVSDSDINAWPVSMRRIKARYPKAKWVIPGHGEVGDGKLVDHSIALGDNTAPQR
ncbi:subclass B1 metallo-beta-lactamase [Chitinivorax sp. B]|uniref:subclass B1 metallo-beta-lactamase n=1 Tax=Chitinivorax sp. B TaxID=2502235 RepID=UPI0010F81994|nr:subclass B1 metallo-beta-lactamase [Chitinivorax sp. B]